MSLRLSMLLLLTASSFTWAGEPVDLTMVSAIREQAFEKSKVDEVLGYLTDDIGHRLSGSKQMRRANEWTRAKLEEWGMENSRVEAWGEFGRGWEFSRSAVHMTKPRAMPILALPAAWTPGTDGKTIAGEVIIAKIDSEEAMEKWKGKLKGKILLVDKPRDIPQADEPLSTRHDHDSLSEISGARIRGPRSSGNNWRKRYAKRLAIREKLMTFMEEEGVVATVGTSSFYGGVVRVSGGGSYKVGDPYGVPKIVMAAEHYTYIHRMVDDGVPVELDLNIEARFYEDDPTGYNTLAEIPGTDKADEIVMLGAHLDSWHGGTGATDNAAGVVVMMEAMRILKALNVTPRRTIRIALWDGEEQGLLGSRGFVSKYFGDWEYADPTQKDKPRWLREGDRSFKKGPEYDHFSAYYNLDNGSGKIRGIYSEGNAAAAPIFKAWLAPFQDVDASTVTLRDTGGTDHQAFDSIGLPGFQFIQEPLAYSTRTHHSNLDVRDNVVITDLMQASAVVATFVYHTAMRDEKMPRKRVNLEE